MVILKFDNDWKNRFFLPYRRANEHTIPGALRREGAGGWGDGAEGYRNSLIGRRRNGRNCYVTPVFFESVVLHKSNRLILPQPFDHKTALPT
ncbi:hypothetical protein EVAR_98019_1 [Eumeta japonica]|uniref:Uncharacterized protein n=1 Tax=Eumeta variegata TaxID=151549 RepID=A0A4C2A6U0_EUMVA|nr:hypothetical protein EVAR_98019_1 [Eumeta japonica]